MATPITSPTSPGMMPSGPILGHVEIHGESVPLTAEPGIDVGVCVSSVPFQDWVKGMDDELKVHHIHFQSLDMFGSRVGFVKFKAHTTFHGHSVPGIVFMRGGAVAILVMLVAEGQRWVVCCRQPRVPCGKAAFLEIPAGMLDGSGKFTGVAAKELKEETGLDIRDDELLDMTALVYGQRPLSAKLSRSSSGRLILPPASTSQTPGHEGDGVSGLRGWYPSVGACDEFLRLMYYSKNVTTEELEALKGKATGCIEDGEIITLELVKLEDLWRLCPDGKTLAALYLYEKLVEHGMIPK